MSNRAEEVSGEWEQGYAAASEHFKKLLRCAAQEATINEAEIERLTRIQVAAKMLLAAVYFRPEWHDAVHKLAALTGKEGEMTTTTSLIGPDPELMLENANLRAEIERLLETDRLREVAFQAYADQEKKDRAEIERLSALHKAAEAQEWRDLQEARAEIERLTNLLAEKRKAWRTQMNEVLAEIERLKAEVKWWETQYGLVQTKLEAALAGKEEKK